MSISKNQPKQSATALQARYDRHEGEGQGASYVPWHSSENVVTMSHSGKYECPLTKRCRHFLSELEEGMTYGCMRCKGVKDVRENIRLATGLTSAICDELGQRHTRSKGAGSPLMPFTTDILVTLDSHPYHVAISGKLRKHLKKKSDWKSLLVEHVYWQLHDVPFLVCTDLEITDNMLESLRFIRPENAKEYGAQLSGKQERTFLRAVASADWSSPLLETVRSVSKSVGLKDDLGVAAFLQLTWRGEINCDLERGLTADTRNAVSMA